MTAQIADIVVYNDEEYQIVGAKGSGLPIPEDFNMTPGEMSTACYRGFYVGYSCKDDALLLDYMVVRAVDDQYKPINGVEADIGGMFNAGRYTGLDLPVKYSGGLLIATDFIQEMYVHMGFQKSTSFKTVIELLFEDGKLTEAIDRSAEVAETRKHLKAEASRTGFDALSGAAQHIPDWIKWTFSLDYEM